MGEGRSRFTARLCAQTTRDGGARTRRCLLQSASLRHRDILNAVCSVTNRGVFSAYSGLDEAIIIFNGADLSL
ncbi:UBP1-associated protein 2C-like [Sesbania bispinosa]|nr:UBP1-associated protein 2C-like [Sesbania bispinosa]